MSHQIQEPNESVAGEMDSVWSEENDGYNLRPRIKGKTQTERNFSVLGDLVLSSNPKLDESHFLFRQLDLSTYPEEYISRQFTRLPQKDKDGRYGNYDGLPWTRVLKLCPFMKDYAVCRAEQKAHKFTDEEKELKSQGLLFRTDVTKLISDDLVVLRQYLRFVKEHEKEIQRPSLVQLLDAVRLTAFVMFTRNRSRAPASYSNMLDRLIAWVRWASKREDAQHESTMKHIRYIEEFILLQRRQNKPRVIRRKQLYAHPSLMISAVLPHSPTHCFVVLFHLRYEREDTLIANKQSISDESFRAGLERLTQDIRALLESVTSEDAHSKWSEKRKRKKAIELQRMMVPFVTALTLGNRREFLIKWRVSNVRWFAEEDCYGVVVTFGEKAMSRLSSVLKLTPQLNDVVRFWLAHGRSWMLVEPEIDSFWLSFNSLPMEPHQFSNMHQRWWIEFTNDDLLKLGPRAIRRKVVTLFFKSRAQMQDETKWRFMLMDLARVLNTSVEMLRSNYDRFCHDAEVSKMTHFMIGEVFQNVATPHPVMQALETTSVLEADSESQAFAEPSSIQFLNGDNTASENHMLLAQRREQDSHVSSRSRDRLQRSEEADGVDRSNRSEIVSIRSSSQRGASSHDSSAQESLFMTPLVPFDARRTGNKPGVENSCEYSPFAPQARSKIIASSGRESSNHDSHSSSKVRLDPARSLRDVLSNVSQGSESASNSVGLNWRQPGLENGRPRKRARVDSAEEESACSLFSMFSAASEKRSVSLSMSRNRPSSKNQREDSDDVSIHSSISNIFVDRSGRAFKMRKISDQQKIIPATPGVE
eukprot:TRINITY_DN5021_c0_g1_i2.p1 TRINITY_DN5021_c0_g1~~TRINITY_DN5021_c0_g1_i2.p1  ORF type:complete len:816 (-),score=97.51 TRINITY_DN5021_c0_g1_i2:3-2450(-)